MIDVKQLCSLSLCVACMYFGVGTCALADTTITSDIEVSSNETLSGTINVTNAVTITNCGDISGTINLAPGKELRIENFGTYNASVVLGDSIASVTQVIKTTPGITELSGIDNYSVLITDTPNALDWASIAGKTSNADRYKFSNAKIEMNGVINITNVDLVGDVFVYINNVSNADAALFTNFSGSGGVHVIPGTPDSLHSMETYISGSSMFVHVARATDYGRILNNNVGVFLENLRASVPDDKLLQRMDYVDTIDDLNRIMDDSVRIHPIKMMRSIKMMYMHKMLENVHIGKNDGLEFTPLTIFSDDMFLIGGNIGLNLSLDDDLYINVFGNVSELKYSDDISSYNGMSYGIGADVIYNLSSNNYVRMYGGMNLSSFNSGMVFNGNGATKDPYGVSGYISGEFGRRFDFADKYYVSPFVTLGGDYMTLLNSDDYDLYVGGGINTGFDFEFDGFRYDYNARGVVRSDGGIGAELNISILSLADAAGAGVRGGVFYDNTIGISYHAVLDLKFDF